VGETENTALRIIRILLFIAPRYARLFHRIGRYSLTERRRSGVLILIFKTRTSFSNGHSSLQATFLHSPFIPSPHSPRAPFSAPPFGNFNRAMKLIVDGGLTYGTRGDGEAVLLENRYARGPAVLIPRAVRDGGAAYAVVALGQAAFHLNGRSARGDAADSVRSVAFPADSEVAFFGDRAFQNSCVQRLQIPPRLAALHPLTFRHTPDLEAVTVVGNPRFVSEGGLLLDAARATLLFVPRNTRSSCFRVPAGVAAVGAFALGDCRWITAVVLPASVTRIEEGAFSGSGLKSVRIPATVDFVGAEFLRECEALESVVFDAAIRIDRIPRAAFYATALRQLVVPRSVVQVQGQAFGRTGCLEEVSFEAGSLCRYILDDAFFHSTVRTIELPPQLEFLQPNFCGCLDLTTIVVNSPEFRFISGLLVKITAPNLPIEIFFSLRSVEGSVAIPNSVEIIHGFAFADCMALTAVHLGNDSALKRIGTGAFSSTGLTSFTVPPKVTEIGNSAFSDCEELKRVEFADGCVVEHIGSEAFRRSGLASFEGPPTLTRLSRSCFSFCAVLKTAILPAKLTHIPQYAFTDCEALEVVRSLVPSGDITIDVGAFPENFNRANLRVNSGVTPVYLRTPGQIAPARRTIAYERAKPPGTSVKDFVLDDNARERLEDSLTRSPLGETYRARRRDNGEISLVKQFTEAERDAFFRQQEIFARVVHPTVLGLIGYVFPQGDILGKIVVEFMPHGSLEALLKDTARYQTTPSTAKMKMVVGIAIAMRYLHACGIMHRDLKPANILLDEHDEIRLSDFRTAKLVDVMCVSMTGGLGTTHFYMAPEMMDENYTRAVDNYAYAMMVWEILKGEPVKNGYPQKKDPGPLALLRHVRNGQFRPSTNGLQPAAVDLLEHTWVTNPKDRLGFREILEYLKVNDYALLPDVNVAEIARYITKLEAFEEQHPPMDLSALDQDEEE
jgi:hypothetical protein